MKLPVVVKFVTVAAENSIAPDSEYRQYEVSQTWDSQDRNPLMEVRPISSLSASMPYVFEPAMLL